MHPLFRLFRVLCGTHKRIEKGNGKNSLLVANFNVNDDMSYDNVQDLRKNHYFRGSSYS